MKEVFKLLSSIVYACAMLASFSALAKPSINWTPSKLSVEQQQGSLSTQIVTVKFGKDAQRVVAHVVPALQKWVTISPSFIGDKLEGESVDLSVSVNIPSDAQIVIAEGVIQLKQQPTGKQRRTITKPLPVEITITIANDDLPPDPGEAGKLTLLGVDTDDDGARDDIQRYIHFSHSSDPTLQVALAEVGKQYQILLSQFNDPEAALTNAIKMARHGECVDHLKGESAAHILAELKAEILNTRERKIKYILYSDSLGGEIVLGRPSSEWKNSCAFDLDVAGGVYRGHTPKNLPNHTIYGILNAY